MGDMLRERYLEAKLLGNSVFVSVVNGNPHDGFSHRWHSMLMIFMSLFRQNLKTQETLRIMKQWCSDNTVLNDSSSRYYHLAGIEKQWVWQMTYIDQAFLLVWIASLADISVLETMSAIVSKLRNILNKVAEEIPQSYVGARNIVES